MLQLLKEIMPFISSVLAITLSFIALTVSIKNRRNVLRENIYNRQVDCFEEIQNRVNKVIDLVYKYQESEQLDTGIEDLHEENDGLYAFVESKTVVLPLEIYKATQDFIEIIGNSILSNTKIDLKELAVVSVKLENDMRVFIGLERLNKENRKLLK